MSKENEVDVPAPFSHQSKTSERNQSNFRSMLVVLHFRTTLSRISKKFFNCFRKLTQFALTFRFPLRMMRYRKAILIVGQEAQSL